MEKYAPVNRIVGVFLGEYAQAYRFTLFIRPERGCYKYVLSVWFRFRVAIKEFTLDNA